MIPDSERETSGLMARFKTAVTLDQKKKLLRDAESFLRELDRDVVEPDIERAIKEIASYLRVEVEKEESMKASQPERTIQTTTTLPPDTFYVRRPPFSFSSNGEERKQVDREMEIWRKEQLEATTLVKEFQARSPNTKKEDLNNLKEKMEKFLHGPNAGKFQKEKTEQLQQYIRQLQEEISPTPPAQTAQASVTDEAEKKNAMDLLEKQMKEVVSSELSYLSSMQALFNGLQNLQGDKKNDPNMRAFLSASVSALEPIIKLSEHMIADFKKADQTPDVEERFKAINEVFARYAPQLKSYGVYASQHGDLHNLYLKVQDDERFKLINQELKIGISSVLIMPVQRGPRCEMLLRELIKRAEAVKNIDVTLASQSFEAVHAALVHINDAIRAVENKPVILSLEKNNAVQIKSHSAGAFFRTSFVDVKLLNKQLRDEKKTFDPGALVQDINVSRDLIKGAVSVNAKVILDPKKPPQNVKFVIVKDGKNDEVSKSFQIQIAKPDMSKLSSVYKEQLYELAQQIGMRVVTSTERVEQEGPWTQQELSKFKAVSVDSEKNVLNERSLDNLSPKMSAEKKPAGPPSPVAPLESTGANLSFVASVPTQIAPIAPQQTVPSWQQPKKPFSTARASGSLLFSHPNNKLPGSRDIETIRASIVTAVNTKCGLNVLWKKEGESTIITTDPAVNKERSFECTITPEKSVRFGTKNPGADPQVMVAAASAWVQSDANAKQRRVADASADTREQLKKLLIEVVVSNHNLPENQKIEIGSITLPSGKMTKGDLEFNKLMSEALKEANIRIEKPLAPNNDDHNSPPAKHM